MTQPTKELLELLGAKSIQITEDTIEFDGQLYVRSTPLREAASDLYAACKALRTATDNITCLIYSCDLPPLLKAIEQVDAAIAKADGRTTEEPSQP